VTLAFGYILLVTHVVNLPLEFYNFDSAVGGMPAKRV